jgi:hypothetical protein
MATNRYSRLKKVAKLYKLLQEIIKYPVEQFACGIRKRHAMPIMVCNILLGELKLSIKQK